MSGDGKLVPGSNTHRIAEFFARNPEEELSTEDARVKFDLNADQLRNALRTLRAHGLVESFHMIRAKRG